jgi:hypothetical protein
VETRDGRILEERSVGPVDLTGTTDVAWVAVAPDGKGAAFVYGHAVGYLYILRGLGQPGR